MNSENETEREYQRYHIETASLPNLHFYPPRFRVKINRKNLALHLIKELIQYRGNLRVVSDTPCVYGVYSGPIGGFAPREEKCVGCLRCSTEYPDIATILPHPEYLKLGDSFFSPAKYDTVNYESKTGLVPVRGAGYRGKFGGQGWDGIWTDMSEIVRPTRDGIHGREFISTEVDIGGVPPCLNFDSEGRIENFPHNLTVPIPILFDAPPEKLEHAALMQILSEAAEQIHTFALLPIKAILRFNLQAGSIIPLVEQGDVEDLKKIQFSPTLIQLAGGDLESFRKIQKWFPESIIAMRLGFEDSLLPFYTEGVRIFHLVANYHGRTTEGAFVLESIRKAHLAFVENKCRDEVTLIGSGGIIAAEHLPKAILCGLDAIAIDTPLIAALQGKFIGECVDRKSSQFQLPLNLPIAWGIQRLKNLSNSWRDQLLEILGAMGLREVRRLRGEMGRAMFQAQYEKDAFSGIEGYGPE